MGSRAHPSNYCCSMGWQGSVIAAPNQAHDDAHSHGQEASPGGFWQHHRAALPAEAPAAAARRTCPALPPAAAPQARSASGRPASPHRHSSQSQQGCSPALTMVVGNAGTVRPSHLAASIHALHWVKRFLTRLCSCVSQAAQQLAPSGEQQTSAMLLAAPHTRPRTKMHAFSGVLAHANMLWTRMDCCIPCPLPCTMH